MVEVPLANLKALYVVKDLAGRPDYREVDSPSPNDPRLRGSHEVYVLFRDGERLTGLVNGQIPSRQFFFVLPIDPNSNNVRILVNKNAILAARTADGSLLSA